jgi:hypothetical protein
MKELKFILEFRDELVFCAFMKVERKMLPDSLKNLQKRANENVVGV